MDKKGLRSKFSEYLEHKWNSIEKLNTTVNRFWTSVFDMFFDWLEYLERFKKNPEKYYNYVFNNIVLPQMKRKARKPYWDIFFEQPTYEKYKLLFISFIEFVEDNKEYIHGLKLDQRKEYLENSLQWLYWNFFNKKELIHAWHDFIQTDTWKNWDKLREYLADIYWLLSDEDLKSLYDILFDSYEICSKITSENHENKWKEGFERKDAFEKAFSNLKINLWTINEENLSKIKSLFWKYLNFIPRYRDKLITTIKWKPEKWERIQKDTETRLLSNFWKGESISKNRGIPWDYSYVWDWFWPMEIIGSDEYGIYTRRWDVLPPDYWIFPDFIPDSEWDFEDAEIGNTASNNLTRKKSEDPIQEEKPHFDNEEKEEEWENPDYTGDYTDFYRNK